MLGLGLLGSKTILGKTRCRLQEKILRLFQPGPLPPGFGLRGQRFRCKSSVIGSAGRPVSREKPRFFASWRGFRRLRRGLAGRGRNFRRRGGTFASLRRTFARGWQTFVQGKRNLGRPRTNLRPELVNLRPSRANLSQALTKLRPRLAKFRPSPAQPRLDRFPTQRWARACPTGPDESRDSPLSPGISAVPAALDQGPSPFARIRPDRWNTAERPAAVRGQCKCLDRRFRSRVQLENESLTFITVGMPMVRDQWSPQCENAAGLVVRPKLRLAMRQSCIAEYRNEPSSVRSRAPTR